MSIRQQGILTFFVVLPLIQGVSQVESANELSLANPSPFFVDAITFSGSGPGEGRLDVFVQVPYGVLGFFQEGDRYVASYEISIDLLQEDGKPYQTKGWTEEISATFEESSSPGSYSLVRHVFEVEPGKYQLEIMVRDLEIRKPLRITRLVQAVAFPDTGFSLSGIMLVNRLSSGDDGKKTIIPNVSANVGHLPNGFHAFLEAYNNSNLDAVRTLTEVLDERGGQVFSEERNQKLNPGRNQVFISVDNSQLTMQHYTLRIHALMEDGTEIATAEKPFYVRWQGMPLASKDLDLAIDQLTYIENPGELDEIKAADDEAEKRKRFLEFWKKRDPTPSTARNEKMEEYYLRVEYANANFAHYIEGWRTDMGMVYIIFGTPDNIDRHPFDIDSKPYEIWSYYNLNHQFTFVDETGFGDYRLTTPIWEVWQRPR